MYDHKNAGGGTEGHNYTSETIVLNGLIQEITNLIDWAHNDPPLHGLQLVVCVHVCVFVCFAHLAAQAAYVGMIQQRQVQYFCPRQKNVHIHTCWFGKS